jgi:hypothetical protein
VPQVPTRTSRWASERPRIGELLVNGCVITQAQLDEALREQSSWGGRLGQNLVDAGIIDERALASAIAWQLGLPLVDLERTPPLHEAARLVPVLLAERYGLVALAVDRIQERILVACIDPTSNEAMREVRRTTGLLPRTCVATATQVDRAVRRIYYGEAEPIPAPDPRLDVRRRVIPVSEKAEALEGLSRRVETLLDLLQRDPDSRL